MSEETESSESIGAEPQSSGLAADPAAVALALGSTSREKADAFLDKQGRVAGRLHLKWGEALLYAGRKDEAARQFAIASGPDLVTADSAELARMRSAHG